MATKNLVVYIWSLDTTLQTDSLDARKANLKTALETAYGDLPSRSDGISPRGLFIAPEYLFAKDAPSGVHGIGSQRQLEEVDKDALVEYMKNLSDTMKGLLIVGGTVAWRKPFDRPEGRRQHSKGALIGTDKLTRTEKARTAIDAYANLVFQNTSDPHTEDLSADWQQSGGGLKTAQTSKDKIDEIWAASVFDGGPAGYVGRNTAYVLLDGNVLLKYNKRGDFHEVLVGDGTVFVPGIFDGRFEVTTAEQPPRTIQFGLEICLDHAVGVLRRTVVPKGRVDVQLITSAAVAVEPKHVAVKNQGYLVHASSVKAYCKVQQICPALTDVLPSAKDAGDTLTVYVLDLSSVPNAVPVSSSASPTAVNANSGRPTKKSRTGA
jgi:hypothetical protein